MRESNVTDLAYVYLNFERKRTMTYDLVSDGMILLVSFMKKVLKKDPRGRLIKIRSITLYSRESTGDFNLEGLTEELESLIKSLKV